MAKLFTIEDNTVVISDATLSTIQGNITHTGRLEVNGKSAFNNDLQVIGTLTAETINVKHLITESGLQAEIGNWVTNAESELVGKGFSWTWGNDSVRLVYNTGRLWLNSDFDLNANHSYKIDNVEVLGSDFLGPQISKSNLKQVGALKSLTVLGNTTLGEFAFFNETTGRLGLNTDQPNGVLSVSENNVEFIITSHNYGVASVGTYTNSDVSIITDNTPRVTIKNTGEVIFGSSLTKSAVVTINGTLNVNNLVADTRLDRYSPLQFNPSGDSSIYGLGLVWTGTHTPTRFVMVPNPDRLFSTESIDLAPNQSYYINEKAVLSETGLGPSVLASNLTTLGTLSSLLVSGESSFGETINARGGISASSIDVVGDTNTVTITNNSINSDKNIAISVGQDNTFYSDARVISIGNKLNTIRTVNLYGQIGINVTNVDSSVNLEVSGDVKFANKKFTTGTTPPVQGTFTKGDICWNQNPIPGSYVGWVCIAEGGPGQWAPFGSIAQQ